jgi:hypothetical protein
MTATAASCITVANTGFPFDRFVLIAAICLAAGALLLLLGWAHRRGRAVGVVALVVLAVGASVIAGASAANAQRCGPSSGSGSGSSLTIVQTSTNIGLAPAVQPAGVTGRVTNRGSADVYVDSITVGIVAVVKTAGASAGDCKASDYVVTRPTMILRRTLHPSESATFGGAAIGFLSTASNQDACQGALVRLRFTSSVRR